MHQATASVNHFIEHGDGLARASILLLCLSTIGCFAYTWGYCEGVNKGTLRLQMLKTADEAGLQLEYSKSAASTAHTLSALSSQHNSTENTLTTRAATATSSSTPHTDHSQIHVSKVHASEVDSSLETSSDDVSEERGSKSKDIKKKWKKDSDETRKLTSSAAVDGGGGEGESTQEGMKAFVQHWLRGSSSGEREGAAAA
jgi:hypothetical protein